MWYVSQVSTHDDEKTVKGGNRKSAAFDDGTIGYRASHEESDRALPIRFDLERDANIAVKILNAKCPANGATEPIAVVEAIEAAFGSCMECRKYLVAHNCAW